MNEWDRVADRGLTVTSECVHAGEGKRTGDEGWARLYGPWLPQTGLAEVKKARKGTLIVHPETDVGGFDVTMNDSSRMNGLQYFQLLQWLAATHSMI